MIPVARYYIVRITVADPEQFLTKMIESKLRFWNVERCNTIILTVKISRNDYTVLENIAKICGANIVILQRKGCFEDVRRLLSRKIICIGMLVFLICALILPTRILFVQVAGNINIPDRLIIEQARDCGIRFGSSRRAVRSEKVKNALLECNENLQWVGVNTNGCIATVCVKERSLVSEVEDDKKVSSIIARRNGVISSVVTLQGSQLCTVGEHVNAGEVLISGYTDCGLKLTATQAIGEVFAHTLRKITLVSPVPTEIDKEQERNHVCYRLKIGKKLINFCNHSGISGVSCDKMYVEEYWTLPGGFQLPICLIRIAETDKQQSYPYAYGAESEAWLKEYAKSYLHSQMIAGKITAETDTYFSTDDYIYFSVLYTCEEMIGQVKYEGTLVHNAEDY